MFLIVLQRLLLDFLWHIIYFPLWWYSKGALTALRWAFDVLKAGNATLAPGLWLKNILVPMYGQNDWQGRLMSFFMRLVNVVIRAGLLGLWMIVSLILFLIWLVLPIFVVYMLMKAV